MTRFSHRLFRLASALNYHLPRRFTKAGLLTVSGMIMAGTVGTDIDQSVAFQAFALLFCLLTVALIWAPSFRGRFTVQRQLPRLASVGQPFRYRVQVSNLSSRPYLGLELMEELAEPHPGYEQFAQAVRPVRAMRAFGLSPRPGPGLYVRPAITKPAPLAPLGPKESSDTEVELLPLRRGPLRLAGLTMARQDPLGLVRGFIRIPLPQSVLVLPKRYPLPSLLFRGDRNYQPGGVALASSIGESEEFISLRDYRPGDPFRRIHWRSWARLGRPVVTEHQDEFFVRHGLVLDTFAEGVRPDTFEEAVSVAASFAWTLETQESLLDLLFVGSQAFCLTTGRGLGQSQQMLEILASVRPSSGHAFEQLRDLVLGHAPVLSGCVCVLLGWDEARRELVRQLRLRGLPVLALILAEEGKEERVTTDLNGEQVHILKPGRIAEGLRQLEGVFP